MILRRGARARDKGDEERLQQPGRNWVVDALKRNVQIHPHWPVYRFLDDKGKVSDFITCYGALHTAQNVAAWLVDGLGLKPGDRVALVYPPGLEFVKAMWGCLFAGVVAVPVCPPNPLTLQTLRDTLPHFQRILDDSGAVAILTDSQFSLVKQTKEAMAEVAYRFGGQKPPQWPDLPWHVSNRAAKLPGDHRRLAAREDQRLDARRADVFIPTDPPAEPDRVAYLQYTSGSTGQPKGVMVTHGNLYQHNEAGWNVFFNAEKEEARAKAAGQAGSVISGTHMLLWLPHFHDFCLTVGILGCGMKGHPLVLMSPLDFIRQPTLWMDFMSRYKTTHTVGPDFSFGLLARKATPQQKKQWDLSNLQFIMSGAEPIRVQSMDAFFGAFKQCGLDPLVFCSAYGLAEHVCGATAWGTRVLKVDRRALEAEQRVQQPARPGDERMLYSCGTPMTGVDLRIVSPDTAEERQREGDVGEIWLSSPCVTVGYYNQPQLNREIFGATLAGQVGSATRYLRTGDMGFVLGGELYVTGRLKDMMILRGRNIYPNDIEDCIRSEQHPLVRPGGLAAFAVDVPASKGQAEEEVLVVMVELQRGRKPAPEEVDELIALVRRTVMGHHGVGCHTVVVAEAGVIRKTTSGKVQRRACRAAFMAGEFAVGSGSKSAKVVRCSTAASAPFHAAGLGADLAGSQEKGADAAPCMHKHSPSAASVRTTDSDQSAGSVISMSESASDSASEGGRDCYMTGSSRSSMLTSPCRSDAEAEAQPSPAANLLAEQLMALPEDQQLDTLLGYMLAQASEASGIDDLDPDQPLLELGLDSLRAAEFAVQIEEHLSLQVPFTVIFEYPTIRLLATHVLDLLTNPDSASLREPETGVSLTALAEAAQLGAVGGQAGSPLLSEAAKAAGVPCSPAQLYFLALEQNSPGGADQNVVGALRLKGALSQEALQGALLAVMRRHNALRTRFAATAAGTLRQVVQRPEEAAVVFACEEAAHLPQAHFQPHCSFSGAVAESLPLPVLGRLQREAGTPFNLVQGPLVRALLVKLGSEDNLLLLTLHHAICDGASFKVMLDEVSYAYNELRLNKAARLPLVRLQYPDFAVWQACRVESSSLQRQIGYWKEQLAGVPELELPADFPRADGHGCARGGWLDIEVPQEVVAGVEKFAADCGATVYMVLLSALQLLLAAHAQQDDIVVASPFAGRVHPATRRTVGCCINTLAMRTRLQGLATLGELVAAVRGTALAAYRNAEASLHTIMQAMGRCPEESLFSVEFNLLELPPSEEALVKMEGLREMELYEVGTGTATSDYYMVLTHAGGRITGRLEYNAELFKHATAQRMASDWQATLEKYAEGNKDMLLSDILGQLGKQVAATPPAAICHEE